MVKNRLLVNASLLLLFCGLLFVLLEICYRVYLFGPASLSPKRLESIQSIATVGLVRASAHREVIYELEPNLDTYFKLTRFRTNSHGLRDREYDLAKPDDTFRIAVVGDSFTMPSGVRGEDAYHSVLEEQLNARGDGVRYEVLNFGVGGYALRHYLATLEHKALAFDPDLVLVGFCAETDHWPGLSPDQLVGPYRPRPPQTVLFHSFAVQKIQTLLGEGRPIVQGMDTTPLKISPKQETQMAERFAQIAGLGRREDLPVLVAYLSNRVRDPSLVKRLVETEGMGFVDVSRRFQGKPLADYVIYRADGHPNEAAHRIFAEGILDHLVESSMLPGPGA